MVERSEHRRVLSLLSSLDAAFLRGAECWFAGGTAVSLRCGEVRPEAREVIAARLATIAPTPDEPASG